MSPPPHPDAESLSLPVLTGNPSGLWLAAGCLRRVADDVPGALLATSGPVPSGRWQGAAADAAQADGHLVAARVASLADRLVRAAAVLEEYGHALDDAQRATTGLQPTSGDGAHPEAAAGLGGRHAAALAELHLAGRVAAHRLKALTAEVGGGPVGPGGQTSAAAWGGTRVDPDPRAAAWAGLEVVAGQRHRDEATGAAAELVKSLDGAEMDPSAVDRAVTLLDRWGRDPVFGAAVWAELTADETQRLLVAGTQGAGSSMAVGGAWRAGRRSAVLAGLGASLAVFVNPAYGTHLDPTARSRIAAARQSWLVRTVSAVPGTVAGWGGTRIPVASLQGQLLAGMGAAGLSPGVAYATTVGVALVGADGAATGTGTDPVLALTEALRGDVMAARAWLLHPLDRTLVGRGGDSSGGLVVDHLVAGRYLQVDRPVAAASMGALGRLVAEAGRDPTSADATLVAGAYLDAVGRTLVRGPRPDAFARVLAPALDDVGLVLGGHADALTAVLDGSSSPGTDRATLSARDRLVRRGRTPGLWEVVLADRATTAAVLGALAVGSQGGGGPLPSAPGPALAHVLGGMGLTLEADLTRAVAVGTVGTGGTGGTAGTGGMAAAGGTAAEIDVAARRLGATTGFVLTTAGIALAGRAADTDAQHRALAGAADLAIGKLSIPGATGTLATPLVRAAAERVVDAAWPTGVEAAQREATAAQLARRREDALVAARTLVSRAQPWTDAQSPTRWALGAGATRSPTVFWDAGGVPLPEEVMTTAQRRSFTDWRRDEGLTVYDVVPQAVRDGIDAGVRDGTATVSGA